MAEQRERKRDRAVYIISVAAELAGVHPQTLRIYERKGLVRPSRTSGNTRRYSDRDIARLRTIQEMTQAGVNLAGVKRILAMQADIDELQEELEEAKQAIEALRRRLREERRRSTELVLYERTVLPWER